MKECQFCGKKTDKLDSTDNCRECHVPDNENPDLFVCDICGGYYNTIHSNRSTCTCKRKCKACGKEILTWELVNKMCIKCFNESSY